MKTIHINSEGKKLFRNIVANYIEYKGKSVNYAFVESTVMDNNTNQDYIDEFKAELNIPIEDLSKDELVKYLSGKTIKRISPSNKDKLKKQRKKPIVI